MSGRIFAGDVFVKDPWDSGSFVLIGNTSSFQVTTPGEIKQRKSFFKASYGRSLNALRIAGNTEIQAIVDDVSLTSLGLLTSSDATVTATPSGQTGTWKRLKVGSAQKMVGLQLCGEDLESGKRVLLTAVQCLVDSNTQTEWLSDGFVSFTLRASCILASGEDADLYVDVQD